MVSSVRLPLVFVGIVVVYAIVVVFIIVAVLIVFS